MLKSNQDEAYRQRHMRVFDVKAWMGSHKLRHAQTLDTVASVVAEYAPKTLVETFAFSPYPFQSRASTKDSLLGAARMLGPGPGALLMIDDPAGMAAEISTRLGELQQLFMKTDERSRKLAVSTAILSLQSAVSDRAEITELMAADELEADSHLVPDGLGRFTYEPDPPKLPETRASNLNRAAGDSWTKYLSDYDEPTRSAWQKEFESEYGSFHDKMLLPLAKSHAAWMESGHMSSYFECHYDGASVDVGLVYARVLTMCTQGTEQFKPCSELYIKWLNGTYFDEKNIALRAIVLNLEKNRKKLTDDLKPDVTWQALGWDGLFGAFNNSIERVTTYAQEVLSKLLISFGGSITQVLQGAADGRIRHLLVALGMVIQRPVVAVELSGSYKTFRTSLIRQLMKSSGVKKMNENAIQREVSLALRRLQIRGEPMGKPVSSKFLVIVDEETIRGMPKGLSKNEQAKWISGSLRSAEEIENLNLSAWRERVNMPEKIARVGKSLPYIGNLLAGYFQWAAYQKVSGDLAKSMKDDQLENQTRLGAAVFAIGATVADTIARSAGALAETTLMAGRGAVLEMAERWFGNASRGLGIFAAGINAVWDAKNSIDAYQQKNYALSTTLGISAIAGLAVAFFIAAGFVIPAIVATLIFIGAGIVATFLQDNNVDKWLKRSYWGVLDAKNRYQNAEIELKELSIATGG
ncbi:T6SS effector BTH_I2691 family protein [Paraburkholderia sp. MPAMCS5]|uniref:T6SS effector BTH_I2691 family protein n=1 Tax=Paraburkholderia sp. MPAMCS5 TaxID=3112563 RepID=UPI003FA69FCC